MFYVQTQAEYTTVVSAVSLSLSLSMFIDYNLLCNITSLIIMSSGDMSIVYSYQVAYANIKNTKLCPPAGFLGSVREFLGVAKQLLLIPFLFSLLPDEID